MHQIITMLFLLHNQINDYTSIDILLIAPNQRFGDSISKGIKFQKSTLYREIPTNKPPNIIEVGATARFQHSLFYVCI